MRFAFHDATEGRPGTMFLMQPAQGKPRPLPADYPTGPEPFKTAADYVAQSKVLMAKILDCLERFGVPGARRSRDQANRDEFAALAVVNRANRTFWGQA